MLSRASGVQLLEVMAVVRGDAGEPLALGRPARTWSRGAGFDRPRVARRCLRGGPGNRFRTHRGRGGGRLDHRISGAIGGRDLHRRAQWRADAVGRGRRRALSSHVPGTAGRRSPERFGQWPSPAEVVPSLEALSASRPRASAAPARPSGGLIVGAMVEWGRVTLGEPIRAVERAARDIARLIVPVACPGCGEHDVRWCDDCAAPWWEAPLRSESLAPRLDIEGRPPLPVWAIAELAGASHSMIVAWKDGGRRDLDRFFADAACRAAAHVAAALDVGRGPVGAPIAVVPVPARSREHAKKGSRPPAHACLGGGAGAACGGSGRRCATCAPHRARRTAGCECQAEVATVVVAAGRPERRSASNSPPGRRRHDDRCNSCGRGSFP